MNYDQQLKWQRHKMRFVQPSSLNDKTKRAYPSSLPFSLNNFAGPILYIVGWAWLLNFLSTTTNWKWLAPSWFLHVSEAAALEFFLKSLPITNHFVFIIFSEGIFTNWKWLAPSSLIYLPNPFFLSLRLHSNVLVI